MAYQQEAYRRVRQEYEEKAQRARADADLRTENMHRLLPALKELDAQLYHTSIKIFDALRAQNPQEKLAQVRAENEELLAKRAKLLTDHGYAADCTDVHYECKACGDTGFVGTHMCDCMRRRLIAACYDCAGIAALAAKQDFSNFSLRYYAHDPENLARMEENFRTCKEYAENFPKVAEKNLLLIGGTGLGKTHLSTSMAKQMIENGHDVVYVSAQSLFADYEFERFGRSYGDHSPSRTARYDAAEVLIVDDLGTEMQNQFTISALYAVLNGRLSRGLPMILNTNLTQKELLSTYADRITSRLIGEFRILWFSGEDIRLQKLRER